MRLESSGPLAGGGGASTSSRTRRGIPARTDELTEGDLSLRTNLFGAACALALVSLAAPASAMDFHGILDGGYSNYDFNHGGGSTDDWHINGGAMFGLAPNWAAQVDAGYNDASGASDSNAWNINGAAFWRANAGRIGATVGYTSIDTNVTGIGTVHATHYGAFGDWYAGRSITVGVKGGAFNGSGSTDGDYLGAQLTGYVMPDLSLTGSYDYTHIKHATNENDFTIQAEYLFSHRVPVSLYGGYTHSSFSNTGGVDANVWFVGLRFYCDPVEGSLVDHQRGGAEIYGTHFGPAGLHL